MLYNPQAHIFSTLWKKKIQLYLSYQNNNGVETVLGQLRLLTEIWLTGKSNKEHLVIAVGFYTFQNMLIEKIKRKLYLKNFLQED